MAILTNTLVNGDLRITGTIFGSYSGSYATCSTAAGTQTKVATIPGFTLTTGAHVYIKFTANNSAANPKLNVSSTGAKNILYRGSAVPTAILYAGRVYEFIYDASSDSWEIVGDLVTVTGVKGSANTDYRSGAVSISAADLGLGNVNNTSDANKPLSDAAVTALAGKKEVYMARIYVDNFTTVAAAYAKTNDLAAARAETSSIAAIFKLVKVEFTSGSPSKFVFQRSYPETSGNLNIRGALEQWTIDSTSNWWSSAIQMVEYAETTASADYAVSAQSASNATNDSLGRNIVNTYATKDMQPSYIYVDGTAWRSQFITGGQIGTGTFPNTAYLLDRALYQAGYIANVQIQQDFSGSNSNILSPGCVLDTPGTEIKQNVLFQITIINTTSSAKEIKVCAGGRYSSSAISPSNSFAGAIVYDGAGYSSGAPTSSWANGYRYTVSLGNIAAYGSKTWTMWWNKSVTTNSYYQFNVHIVTIR